ncbi:hypothetical protein BSKO_07492 [Bryopsis sp. KO-2023]|nr:hypothetical protein BSKO_07492 [Bryopsis sp. KO-2023]
MAAPHTNRLSRVLPLVGALVLLSVSCSGKTVDEWRSRSIYQLLTDRFATLGKSPEECDLTEYCGGNFLGLVKKLRYIKRMGFDAIWISPVVENTPNGYHGYWTKDLFSINPEFGTARQLKSFVRIAHRLGIWVMVDVVANHMGYVEENDFSSLNPFDKPEEYHDCEGCDEFCNINDFNNFDMVEHCRLSGLPDLDQNNPYVRSQLLEWIEELVKKYKFDGVRIDTVPLVEKDFWAEFSKAAGVFTIGEVFDGRIERLATYFGDAMDSLVDYPMYYTLRDVFQRKGDMTLIPYRRGQQKPFFPDVRVLGTFVDNHDNPRFLHDQKDEALYRNALAFVLLGEGIPIVYYGTEQGFAGGEDPENREPLWVSKYSRQSKLFKFIAALNKHRKKSKVWESEHVELYVDNACYVFSRGSTIVGLTNVGAEVETSECTFEMPDMYSETTFDVVYPDVEGEVVNTDTKSVTITFYGGEPVVLAENAA